MLFDRIIAERRIELTAADRRLVDVLLGDRTEGSFLPAHEIAERAGVHASTAGRLARKLGFESYRAMRNELRNDLLSDLDASKRIRNRLERAAGTSLLQSVIEGEINALAALAEQVSQATIRDVTARLKQARHILVLGEGHAGSLADIFVRRLKRSGYCARALSHLDWETADELIGLKRDDVLVGFIFRHDSPGIAKAFDIAAQARATSILLTDRPTAPLADIAMAIRRGEPGEFQSLTVPMAVCNALILELSKADGGYSLAALGKLEQLRQTFEAPAGVSRRR